MNRLQEIQKFFNQNCGDWGRDDVEYLLSIIKQAETDLEQTKHYLEAEAYTNAWKETIRALKSIQGEG